MLPDTVEVEMQSRREACATQVDPVLIHDMLLNLCLNSKDAMPQGGRLSIGIERLLLEAGHPDLGPDMSPGHYFALLFVSILFPAVSQPKLKSKTKYSFPHCEWRPPSWKQAPAFL